MRNDKVVLKGCEELRENVGWTGKLMYEGEMADRDMAQFGLDPGPRSRASRKDNYVFRSDSRKSVWSVARIDLR